MIKQVMNRTILKPGCTLTFIFFLFSTTILAQNTFVLDTTLSDLLPQSLTNSIKVGDVNNDGVNDIIISGYDEFNRTGGFVDVIRGNSDGTLTIESQIDFGGYPDTIAGYWEIPDNLPVGVPIGGIGGVDLADANRDGWIDIYYNGCARSKLLINSSGSFSASTGLENMSLTYSDGKWGDMNMDGAPDLFVMGVNEYTNNILNELFINDGTSLEEDPTTIFPALFNGSSSWGDYDNDGDPDLIICGQTADKTASVTRFYQNEPTGRLTELTTADEVGGLKAGTFRFVDLDSDGDQDMIMSGWNKIQGRLVTWILRNEPLGTFSLIPNQIDFAVAYGTIDAIDFNLDGLQDFVIAGADSVTHHAGKIHSLSGRVYLNDGDGTFSPIKEIPGARVARFADINHDSIPDLIASGTTEFGNNSSTFSHVYLNTAEGTNHPPEAPAALTAFAVSTRAIFTWSAGMDDIDDPSSLSYNIRIGTSSGGYQLMSSSVPYNSSNVGHRLIREFNEIPHGTYYWAIQTVDAAGNKSNWSPEDTLFISRLVTSTQSLPGVYFSTAGWADYDEDDLLDLALSGIVFSGGSITNLFKNDDGLLNQDLTQNIVAVFGGHLSWVDYTNDGHLDLSLSGFQIINFQGFPATYFYKWENGIYVFDPQDNVTTSYYGYTMGINGGSNNHSWGDYDNDGDLDFVIGGIDFGGGKHLKVFRNHTGTLILDETQTDLVPIFPCITHWVDLNLDGYLDLVTIGSDSVQSLALRVYLNNSNYILTSSLTWNSEIYGVTAGAIDFADYNDDGYEDFALTGLNSSGDLVSYIATNAINTFIVSGGHMLTGVYYGRPTWGDYDSDGDWDLLISGLSSTADGGSIPFTGLYAQEDGVFTIDGTIDIDSVGFSFSQFGDYDADGDLDLFLAGITSNSDVSARVYDNLEGLENANKAPNAPYGLDDSNINDDKVTLTWTAPVDPENAGGGSTPEDGLRYQIQIGSEEENNEHAISTGNYGVGNIGTINRTEKIIRNIPEGSYGWKVRAIDHGYAVSDWSSTDYFYIDVTAPTVDTIRANYVSEEQIILIVKFKEDFYLDLNVNPTVLVTHPDDPDIDGDGIDDTLTVEKQSFNGDEWTGVLILPEEYAGKAIQVQVSGAQDVRKNEMADTTIYKTPETIVAIYPGDTDNNGIVNEFDILPIGIYFHESGYERNSMTYSWGAEYSIPWDPIYATYADINGDGFVNQIDVIGIGLNWGNTHFNGTGGNYGIASDDQDVINENMDAFIDIYNSLSGSGTAIEKMKTLLKSIIFIEIPLEYSLGQNHPNPFNPTTQIKYDIPEDALVSITIYDIMGRSIKSLVNSNQTAGYHSISWDGKNNLGEGVSAGMYIYTIQAGEFRQTKKMVLLK
jgi:hypothetical protein